jgi:hypothetical protein
MFQRLLGTVALSADQWQGALGGDPYACGHRQGHPVAPAKQSRFICPTCPMTSKRHCGRFRVWSSAGWCRRGRPWSGGRSAPSEPVSPTRVGSARVRPVVRLGPWPVTGRRGSPHRHPRAHARGWPACRVPWTTAAADKARPSQRRAGRRTRRSSADASTAARVYGAVSKRPSRHASC